MANVRPEVLAAQRSVFDLFGLPLEQIESTRTHGQFLTDTLRDPGDGVRAVVFFDVDCVPLEAGVVGKLVAHALGEGKIVGCAQQANHLDEEPTIRWQNDGSFLWRLYWRIDRNLKRRLGRPLVKVEKPFVYAAPFFVIVPIEIYEKIGQPSMESDGVTYDVGARLTAAAREHNVPVRLLRPTACVEPKFWLEGRRNFGLGTTYDDMIFHAFETTYRANGKVAGVVSRTVRNSGQKLRNLAPSLAKQSAARAFDSRRLLRKRTR